jgi:hypothetical protein
MFFADLDGVGSIIGAFFVDFLAKPIRDIRLTPGYHDGC